MAGSECRQRLETNSTVADRRDYARCIGTNEARFGLRFKDAGDLLAVSWKLLPFVRVTDPQDIVQWNVFGNSHDQWDLCLDRIFNGCSTLRRRHEHGGRIWL